MLPYSWRGKIAAAERELEDQVLVKFKVKVVGSGRIMVEALTDGR